MKTATIIITDIEGEDKVKINVEFGSGGCDVNSIAHQTAMSVVKHLIENQEDEND